MESSKSIAQEDGGQGIQQSQLMAARPTNKRGSPDSHRPGPVEMTPDGAIKISSPDAPIFKLVSILLTGSNATLFAAKSRYTNLQIVVASVDNSAAYNFTLYHLTGTESAGDSTALGKNIDMPAGCDPIAFTDLGLERGDSIAGLASTASKINVTIYGTPLGV